VTLFEFSAAQEEEDPLFLSCSREITLISTSSQRVPCGHPRRRLPWFAGHLGHPIPALTTAAGSPSGLRAAIGYKTDVRVEHGPVRRRWVRCPWQYRRMSEERSQSQTANELVGRVVGSTARMQLSIPHDDDVEDLFAMYSDPRVAEGDQLLRHSSIEQTREAVARAISAWERDGTGLWVLRANEMDSASTDLIGVGGCGLLGGRAWNLSFTLRPEHWGKGYAQEVAAAGIEQAKFLRPDLPVTAVVAEHNARSHRAVERAGLSRLWQGSDSHDSEPEAMIALYADRPLSDAQIQWLTD
jgi:ribosomal-protein-alanine N-acetyltransferase